MWWLAFQQLWQKGHGALVQTGFNNCFVISKREAFTGIHNV
jgi:hypothetical protein